VLRVGEKRGGRKAGRSEPEWAVQSDLSFIKDVVARGWVMAWQVGNRDFREAPVTFELERSDVTYLSSASCAMHQA
jgi:hypothetical protein